MKTRPSHSTHWTHLTLLVLAVVATGGAGLWMATWKTPRPAPLRMTAAEAERPTRRIEVTLADVQATWKRIFRSEGKTFAPVEHRFFVRSKQSPCVKDGAVTGPFYCSKDRTMNFDLAFFAAITPQLREIEEPASKLVVAQIAAEAVQDQLGLLNQAERDNQGRSERPQLAKQLALQADCLTGIWAADAQRRLGPVPERRYATTLQGMRRITEAQELESDESPQVLNSFGVGNTHEREASFFKGYESGKLSTCLRQGPTRRLGD